METDRCRRAGGYDLVPGFEVHETDGRLNCWREITSLPNALRWMMQTDFARKLRLIMRVLGTATHKELHGRLRTINPETGYRPDRAYKWATGRAMPRDLSIYDDLALLLDLNVSGDAICTSSYTAFRDLMVARYGKRVPLEDPDLFEATEAGEVPIHAPSSQVPSYLVGPYLAFSRAWSAHRPNDMIVGEMTIRVNGTGDALVDYNERVPPLDDLSMSGTLDRLGGSLHVLLTEMDKEMLISMTFSIPPSPIPIMIGVMSGIALPDAERRPTAGRIICIPLLHVGIAVNDDGASPFAPLDDVRSYISGTPAAVADRLQTVGVDGALSDRIAGAIVDFVVDDARLGLINASMGAIESLQVSVLAAKGQL